MIKRKKIYSKSSSKEGRNTWKSELSFKKNWGTISYKTKMMSRTSNTKKNHYSDVIQTFLNL